jgi:hypothetical protein
MIRCVAALVALSLFIGCAARRAEETEIPVPAAYPAGFYEDCADLIAPLDHIKRQLERLPAVELTADLSHLSPGDRKALDLLVKASWCMDKAFMRQVYEWNYCIIGELSKSMDPGVSYYQNYFCLMYGPWDRLDDDRPFLNADAKPPGANFYPMNMTREEFDAKAIEEMKSAFTMVRRVKGKLEAIPYSEYFEDELKPCAKLLKQAAKAATTPSLARYLASRAEALLCDDYLESDRAWMELDGDIEAVLGPYEVYEDRLFGYKASFQSQVCIVDHEEARKLEAIGNTLGDLEARLPLPETYERVDHAALSPIKVALQVYSGGDARAGIMTAAFNLPNDERVRREMGSKKVLLKNVMFAKFESCSIPVAEAALSDKDLKRVSFEAFFNHFLMHEISHGLGPGAISANGRDTTVNRELKDLYAFIEECKADAMALYSAPYLVEKGVLPADLEETLYATYLADIFRSLRFGINDAQGGSTAMQLNYLLERGAFAVDEAGLFFVNDDKIRPAVEDLTRELLEIQAKGDYKAAQAFIARYRHLKPEAEVVLKKLDRMPVDIRPVYPIEKEVLQG